jgi:hypothetical protein
MDVRNVTYGTRAGGHEGRCRTPIRQRPSAIVTAPAGQAALADVPKMTQEEHRRRGDGYRDYSPSASAIAEPRDDEGKRTLVRCFTSR